MKVTLLAVVAPFLTVFSPIVQHHEGSGEGAS